MDANKPADPQGNDSAIGEKRGCCGKEAACCWKGGKAATDSSGSTCSKPAGTPEDQCNDSRAGEFSSPRLGEQIRGDAGCCGGTSTNVTPGRGLNCCSKSTGSTESCCKAASTEPSSAEPPICQSRPHACCTDRKDEKQEGCCKPTSNLPSPGEAPPCQSRPLPCCTDGKEERKGSCYKAAAYQTSPATCTEGKDERKGSCCKTALNEPSTDKTSVLQSRQCACCCNDRDEKKDSCCTDQARAAAPTPDSRPRACCTGGKDETKASCCKTGGGCQSQLVDSSSPCSDSKRAILERDIQDSGCQRDACCEDGPNQSGDCCDDRDNCDGFDDGSDGDSECCSDTDSCACDESCQYNYHLLYHQTIGCKRQSTVVSDQRVESISNVSTAKNRFSCTRCLGQAKDMGKSVPAIGANAAKTCYCSLTRALGKSVRSLAGLDFAKGCCRVRDARKYNEIGGGKSCQDRGCGAPNLPVADTCNEKEAAYGFADDKHIAPPPQIVRHLALGVSGMTCSGCADKAAYVLRGTRGVMKEDVRVSFVMGRAELTFVPELVNDVSKEIVGRLKRMTGFEVVMLLNSETAGEELDGILTARIRTHSDGNAGILREKLRGIPGITNVVIIDSQEVQISYDPDETGVRTVLFNLEAQLERSGRLELRAMPDDEAVAQRAEKHQLSMQGVKLFLAIVFTIPVLVLAWSSSHITIDHWRRHTVECVFATCVIIVAYKIYFNAGRTLVYGGAGAMGGRIDMDTLVAVATLAAYGFSLAVFILQLTGGALDTFAEQSPFFETSSLLTTLILMGRWITALIRWSAMKEVQNIGGNRLQEKTVLRVESEDREPVKMDAHYLHHDDIVAAHKGMKVVTDGIVVAGEADVDESHLTGEARPQARVVGSYVLAGSTVVTGDLHYRVTKLLQENTISTIKGMVTTASRQKPRTQEIADKVAAYLTPALLILACVIFLIWLFIAALAQGKGWGAGSVKAATYAVATLAISCPCAIGLAVPMVLVVASRIGVTKGGFVFKNAAAVEKGWNVSKVIFDKTGTLTTGQLDVVYTQVLVNGNWQAEVPNNIKRILGQLCRNNSHPVSKGMFRFSGVSTPTSSTTSLAQAPINVTAVVSNGLEATIDGSLIRGGKPSFTCSNSKRHSQLKYLLDTDKSLFTLSRNNELIGVFGLHDRIRPETPDVLRKLKKRGIGLYIFSGDHPAAVHSVARELGIPKSNVRAGCKPEEKEAALQLLRQESAGHGKQGRAGSVLFVGDGTNDAIALMTADIGVSLSKSTELAANSADVAILKDSLEGVIGFLELARRVQICVFLNFCWAVVWNFVAILAACGAFVKFRIAPEWAGLGEMGSVLPVFLVSALVGWGWAPKTRPNQRMRSSAASVSSRLS